MIQSILDIPPAAPGERIAYGKDPNQFGELRRPAGKGPHPVLIFIHGGFWKAAFDLKHAGHLCEAMAKAGLAVWSVEYRRAGQAGGGYPGTLEDIRAAALQTKQIPDLDLNRVVVAGHSAGGQLALWLAAQNAVSVRGVVALAAVSDLRKGYELGLGGGAVEAFMGCVPARCGGDYAKASPIELLPMKVPQVLLHGTADSVVPFEFSEGFAKKSGNARLVSLMGAGHLELIDPRSKEFAAVRDSILKAVQPSPA